MRTEIIKKYSWGFVATEQNLRRLVQAAVDHLQKPVGAVLERSSYTVKLKDGAIVETTSIDDIFQIENIGNKLIREVSVQLSSNHPAGQCSIKVDLMDGAENEKNWNSVVYTISGDTRDWAFVAAAEIDERIRRMKVIAWESVFSSKWMTTATLFLGMFGAIFGSIYFKSPDNTHVILEGMYKAGKFANPIEALIALEQIKANRSDLETLMPLFAMYGIMAVIFFGGGYFLQRLSPSYNFCWGEYAAQYEKRIRLRTGLLTLVVISLVVSVFANFVSKKLGI